MLIASGLIKVMAQQLVLIQYVYHFVLLHANTPLVVEVRNCHKQQKLEYFIPEPVTLKLKKYTEFSRNIWVS
jgi:hypothetical protein